MERTYYKDFKPRYTTPDKNDKLFIREIKGGYCPCAKGYPQVYPSNDEIYVLNNCTGGSFGRAMENAKTTKGKEISIGKVAGLDYPQSAGRWYEDYKCDWVKGGMTPRLGAIGVWKNSGNGHVATVEEIRDGNVILFGEGSYGSSKGWFTTLVKPPYKRGALIFQGFRYNPAIIYPEDLPFAPVERDESKHQVRINVTNLRVREEPSLKGRIIKGCPQGVFDVLDEVQADGYRWLLINQDKEFEQAKFWVAFTNDWGIEYFADDPLEKLQRELNQAIIKIDALEKENASLRTKIEEARKVLE